MATSKHNELLGNVSTTKKKKNRSGWHVANQLDIIHSNFHDLYCEGIIYLFFADISDIS